MKDILVLVTLQPLLRVIQKYILDMKNTDIHAFFS